MSRVFRPFVGGACALPPAALLGLALCFGGGMQAAVAGAVPTLKGANSLVHPVSVFGDDQRVPLPQSLREAGSKLGVLYDSRSHSVCTAFCVAPDVVATAAH